jgi:hypothetical protein
MVDENIYLVYVGFEIAKYKREWRVALVENDALCPDDIVCVAGASGGGGVSKTVVKYILMRVDGTRVAHYCSKALCVGSLCVK